MSFNTVHLASTLMVQHVDMRIHDEVSHGLFHLGAVLIAIAMGLALAQSGHNLVFKLLLAITPLATFTIARVRTRAQSLATVHSLSEWRIDFHSDTTLATGAAAHHQAL